eukprot:2281871-Prymnesium_polylepis.1
MLVPCSGIRRSPKHRAKPDNFDEALCMMGMIRAIVRRYEFGEATCAPSHHPRTTLACTSALH